MKLSLGRLERLLSGSSGHLRILEPSAGDGAFVRGLANSPIATESVKVTAIEIDQTEAERCRSSASSIRMDVDVICDDFLQWQSSSESVFDLAIGNPPFVRFQFISGESKAHAARINAELGLPSRRLSNLWTAIILGALSTLRIGGAFAFIVPFECFTGVSARAFRTWLTRNCRDLTFDIFSPGAFPEVLQEVVIMSGSIVAEGHGSRSISICDHDAGVRRWSHIVDPDANTWTSYLLDPSELEALNEALSLSQVTRVGRVARFEVAAVTGANAFFSVNRETIDLYDLEPWTVDLLPRIRHARGLRYTPSEHDLLGTSGNICALLDFGPERPDPIDYEGALRYLDNGEKAELHTRYKTRIRHPWYRVPHIRPGQLLLSKRSHWFPRAIVNEASVVTTDTIYRGSLLQGAITPSDFAVSFHSSLTALSAEIVGRSFGGGVLELVPSEVAQLAFPVVPGIGIEIDVLDEVARSSRAERNEDLIRETNAFLAKAEMGLSTELLDQLEGARYRLLARRLARNSPVPHSALDNIPSRRVR